MSNCKFIYLASVLSMFLVACFSSSNVGQPDYTYLYDPEQKLITPQIKVYHDSEDSSELYFRIHTRDLLYGKLQNDSNLTTRILLRYKIYEYEAKNKMVDSSTMAFIHRGQDENVEFLEGKARPYLPSGKLYRMKIAFRDQYKDLNTIYEFIFDKRLNGNQEFYLMKQNGEVLYNFISAPNKGDVELIKSPLISNSNYTIDSVNHTFEMTPPPFVENVKGEQLVFKPRGNYTLSDELSLGELAKVNRLIPEDSNLLRLHFFEFSEDFPYVNRLEQMVDPIRYISTTSEYKKVKNAVNLKKQIDAFWMKIAKDENTARFLIREYYSRVEIANMSFSSFKEGWKTDRGIIFIVYGQPTSIYKDALKEVWTYGEENNILSVKFTFLKIRSEESNNIWVLQRDSEFKSNWYRAVDDWRQGRITS